MKWLKRSIIIILAAILLLALTATTLAFIYQKEVKQYFVTQLNNHLATPVQVESYDLSLFHSFPLASLEFKNISIKENTDRRTKSDLLTAQSIYLKFNIMDIFSKNYDVKKLEIAHATILLHIDENGNENYIFWKKSTQKEQSNFSVELNNIELKDIDITFINEVQKSKALATIKDMQFNGHFSREKYRLKAEGGLFIKDYSEKDVVWVKNRSIQLNNALKIDNKKNEITLTKGNISIDGVSFSINGNAEKIASSEGYNLNVKLNAENQEVGIIKSLVPYDFKQKFDNYDLKGKATFNIKITGELSKTKTPRFDAAFELNKVEITNNKNKTHIENLSGKGRFVYYHKKGPGYSRLELNAFHFNIDKNSFDGTFALSNFFNPYVELKINADLPLKPVINFLDLDTVQNPSGMLKAHLNLKGYVKNLKEIKPEEYQKINATGKITFKDVGFKIENSNFLLSNLNGTLIFNKQEVKAENITFNSQHSDFDINGNLHNFLAWLFTGERKLDINATLKSKHLYLDELMFRAQSGAGNKSAIHFPQNITCQLKTEINEFIFERFKASNISGNLSYKNKQLGINNLTFNSMEGKIKGNLFFQQDKDNQILSKVNANLSNINVRKLFYEFRNFDQNTMGAANLKGYLDANGIFSCIMDSTLSIKKESVKLHSNIQINKGELIDFQPTYALSKYIDLDELKDIHFSKLTTEVNIQNDTIFFPETAILSSALDLKFFGTHTFDNKVDYHFELTMRELLWGKAQKAKRENKEFGYVVDDGTNKAKLFIKMTGDMDNPEISYDKKSLVNKWKKDFKKESHNLKGILHKQLGWYKKDSSLKENTKQQEEAPYQIEWNAGGKESKNDKTKEENIKKEKKVDEKPKKEEKKKKKSFFNRLTSPNKDEYVEPAK